MSLFKTLQQQEISRRLFLSRAGKASALAATGMATQPFWLPYANAATPAFSDYKAMVCVFLYGGNDSWNMLIPTGNADGTGYADYADIRGSLAISNTELSKPDLNSANLSTGSGNPYDVDNHPDTAYNKGLYGLASKGIDMGVNGVMPELAQLITDNKASISANTGNLVEFVSKAQAQDPAAVDKMPLFLFAHNHQQRALQTGQADNLDSIGWAGRIGDAWNDVNNNNPIGLGVSYFTNDRMLIGNTHGPLVLGTGAPPAFTGMDPNNGDADIDRRALFRALAGTQGSGTNVNFGADRVYSNTDRFANLYNSYTGRTVNTFGPLSDAWAQYTPSYSSKGSYGEDLFSIPSAVDLNFDDYELEGRLIPQLESVAKMIWLGATGKLGAGYNRQVFYVRLGGFDTHASQNKNHALLLRELSLGLWKFQKAMEELNLANNVTTFTMSDFGRTVSNNGDGTDHGWGANHIVMGGDGLNSSGNLKGGQMLGAIPDIRLGGADDMSTDKGRIIPTIAQDQLNASLCQWFGVDNDLMPTIFPNLQNFAGGGPLDDAYLDLFA